MKIEFPFFLLKKKLNHFKRGGTFSVCIEQQPNAVISFLLGLVASGKRSPTNETVVKCI